MLAAIEAGIITPSTKSRLMELEAERGQIEKGIAQQLISEPTLERDQVVYFLERFREGDVTDDGYRAFLVDTFLNAAYLYDDDKLVLVLNYTGERCKVTLELVEKAVEGDPGGSCFAPSGAPMRMAIQYLKDAVSPFAFLLLEANGGGGQCDLILYGDQADTEFLQAIYVRIGVQEIAAQPGHARYDHGTHPPV